ncbi:MAG: tryptophan synthase subunit alpha, partial [Sphingomicrobium sp.]
MSRYAAMFDRLDGEGAFGAFLMLGDPDLAASAILLDAVVASGADMVEVGIPFSDPVADGPVIQAAAKRALDAGVKVADCFALIAAFRARHSSIPIGILTYANLVMARGRDTFFRRAADAGADSLLVADLPAREAEPWAAELRAAGLDPVLIAASNTPPETVSKIARLGAGYTYCVTRAGITGVQAAAEFDRGLIAALGEAGAA